MSVQTFIDGENVTDRVLSGSVTPRLNGPRQATVRMPLGSDPPAPGGAGSLLKVVVDGSLDDGFHGRVMVASDDGDENKLYTEYQATDPWELWQWRPARDPDGDFSKPSFFTDLKYGPQIMESILTASNDGSDQALGEGPLRLQFGTFETGGVDLSGAPVDWPMTISEIAALLTSTGEVDIVLTPIDSGGNLARIDVYNGDYGTDRTGSVSFDYATGNYNAAKIRRVEDMSNLCNKLWYYGGPRVETSTDPAGDQHWRFNVTGDDDFADVAHGGVGSMDPPASNVLADRLLSRGQYDVRMEVKIFDADPEAIDVLARRYLYRRLWLMESWLRQRPKTMVHVTPVRGTPLNFGVGDLVSVRAGAKVRGGFSGGQRVYSYTYSWDENGTRELSELVTSPNQEGM